jgi:flavodoxin
MKSLIVYDTSYGNTKLVAEIIYSAMKKSRVEADFFYIKDTRNIKAQDYDVLILGSPTKFYTMSFTAKSFISKLKTEDWANKPFVAFDTENPENVQKKKTGAAEKIAEKLIEKKMSPLMPNLKVLVFGQKGPFVEGENKRIANFAEQTAIQIKKLTQGGK